MLIKFPKAPARTTPTNLALTGMGRADHICLPRLYEEYDVCTMTHRAIHLTVLSRTPPAAITVLTDLALQAARHALMTTELRLSSLEKVVQMRRRDMALAQQRRDQKQTDERAALQFIGRTFGMQFQEV